MKFVMKRFFLVVIFLIALVQLTGCEQNKAEIEQMKIEETVGTFMRGYETNNATQILSVVNLDESKKSDFEGILAQILRTIHHEPYNVKIAYQIDNMIVNEDSAELKIGAVMRIFENDSELVSIRLFKNQNLYLLKDAKGEWKINFKQFIPAELLKIDLLF